jgi:hypothetical protein
MLRIEASTIEWTIGHLLKHGDTDIFPYPIELRFFADKISEIADQLSKIDLTSYRPMSALESLVPKSRYNFRVSHQLYPVDSVLLLAAIATIASELESCRLPAEEGPFSYRCLPTADFDFFSDGCRYGTGLGSNIWNYVSPTDIRTLLKLTSLNFTKGFITTGWTIVSQLRQRTSPSLASLRR